LALFEGCEEQVSVLVPSKPKVGVNHLEVFKIYFPSQDEEDVNDKKEPRQAGPSGI
jgi:predicted CopG family antitoxin